MSDNVKYISQNDFEKEVLKSGNVIVDFYSTECPPCEALSPKFELFAKNYSDKIKFIKIFYLFTNYFCIYFTKIIPVYIPFGFLFINNSPQSSL